MGCLDAKGRVSKNNGARYNSLKNAGLEINPAIPSNLDSRAFVCKGMMLPT